MQYSKIISIFAPTTGGTVVSSKASAHEARAVYNASTKEVTIYVDANYLLFPKYSGLMFAGFTKLTAIDWSAFSTSIDTRNVKDMSLMFFGCSSLTALDVAGFDTRNVTNMNFLFDGCSSLTSLNVTGFSTSNVTGMNSMFSDCSSLTSLNVASFDTGNVTGMNSMFDGCSSLTSLYVANFSTSNVTYMEYMFYKCYQMTLLRLSQYFTIKDGCNIDNILGYMADSSSQKCTITCTRATKAKLEVKDTSGISSYKIIWNLLD